MIWVYPSLERRVPLPRHEILIETRGRMEANHRTMIHHRSVRLPFRPCPYPSNTCPDRIHNHVEDLSVDHAEDCCNKNVPKYMIPGQSRLGNLLPYALHNWLYHKWYRLYRSDIEYGQFIAKLFVSCSPPMDTPTVSLVGQINDLNARICSKVASIQKYVQTCPIGERFSPTQTFRDERFYVMQPLFKAVTIILLNDEYDVRMVDVGKMPALLTLTGEEDGLSQQLSFKSISDKVEDFISETIVLVRLNTAIKFVVAQQEREVALYGPQPDPVESTKELENGTCCNMQEVREFANQLGWTGEPLQGPSSTWLDPEIYTEWLGNGAKDDKNLYGRMEDSQRWNVLLRTAGLEHTLRRLIKRRSSIA
ncbi:hypothetical protein FOWG_00239 [Fusarium oxysporum f. sp. lycopersici MN25]|nr:hypothetical protein FOWG_00239 [Fusarium oxysporum f. sp. lycopersici MN25]